MEPLVFPLFNSITGRARDGGNAQSFKGGDGGDGGDGGCTSTNGKGGDGGKILSVYID
jgi:hypothetical protein